MDYGVFVFKLPGPWGLWSGICWSTSCCIWNLTCSTFSQGSPDIWSGILFFLNLIICFVITMMLTSLLTWSHLMLYEKFCSCRYCWSLVQLVVLALLLSRLARFAMPLLLLLLGTSHIILLLQPFISLLSLSLSIIESFCKKFLNLNLQLPSLSRLSCIFNLRGMEKVQFLKSLGVDHVVDSGSENVTASVKEFLKTRKLKGVDVLYDPVGGKLTKESMKLLNWGAQILVIGFASGEIPVIPANIALVKVHDSLFSNANKTRAVEGYLILLLHFSVKVSILFILLCKLIYTLKQFK